MWFSAIKLAISAGSHIYKKRQETRMLMADAQRTHAQRMARGEIEYKQAIIQSHQGWKDEFFLILVSAPIMLLIWSVFSNDPAILEKISLSCLFHLKITANTARHEQNNSGPLIECWS